ncbi:MAG: UvrD-helicase domain-containing protein [Epsilonproteobacteria bacterium]|nr:UvrD-helicase domain-containing protein [Campylobacterota bacterium]
MSESQAPNNFNTFLEADLNQPQRNAVTKTNGALMVISGAGSGKTRVITSRIAHLMLNEGVQPYQILALTFTNKAAGEMKERIASFLGTEKRMPFVGTFHSYCLLLLRLNKDLLPFKEFSIFDGDDQLELIKKIIKRNALNKYTTASQASYQISQFKNKQQNPDQAQWTQPWMRDLYLEYETEKNNAHCLDFDDLIIKTLGLFATNEEFKKRHQNKIRHVLVDEYQDTSSIQHQLLKHMGLTNNKFTLDSLCAVGDEDQSIYSWRGANVTNMLTFEKDFAPVTTIKIEQNYRSVQPIIEAANSVIANNKLRNPKKLWSEKKAINRILHLSCRNGEQEAESVAIILSSLPKNKKLSDVAILYRTHFQSRLIEEALIYHSIAYQIIGGIRFYERKEIKDLLAYLRLMLNPFDKISLLRVINCPARRLGAKFEEFLLDEWNKNPLLNFKQLFAYLEPELSPMQKKGVDSFLELFSEDDNTQRPSTLLESIVNKTEYLTYLKDTYDEKEATTKVENVREFMQSIMQFEKKKEQELEITTLEHNRATSELLAQFLEEVALLQEKVESENSSEQVRMMSLHAAKGLEFDTVIIIGLEEELLPSRRSLDSHQELEEERRLFYVGITRAKEHLVLLNAHTRYQFGQLMEHAPSRFLEELPQGLLKKIDLEYAYPSQIRTQFEQWYHGRGALTPAAKTYFENLSYPFKEPTKKVTPGKKVLPRKQPAVKQASPNVIQSQPSNAPWKKNQQVKHKKFGLGIITHVEEKNAKEYYITAIFSIGSKKILSNFLEKV